MEQPLLGGLADGGFLLRDLPGALALRLADGLDLGAAAFAAGGEGRKALFQRSAAGGSIFRALFQRGDLRLGQLRVLLAGQLFQPLGAQLIR